jgi:hypothetical protein
MKLGLEQTYLVNSLNKDIVMVFVVMQDTNGCSVVQQCGIVKGDGFLDL